jgi:hypothetical protein
MHDYFNVGKLSNGARTAQRANSIEMHEPKILLDGKRHDLAMIDRRSAGSSAHKLEVFLPDHHRDTTGTETR